MRRVSIVIPAYNEEAFIGTLLGAVQAVDTESLGFEKEIIVVNDGSKDRTGEVVRGFSGVMLIEQENRGKGAAVQRGIGEATGDFILVQDADLEYDPVDYRPMLEAIREGAQCVYGSRTLGQLRARGWTVTPGRHPEQSIGPWMAGWILSSLTFVLYGVWISDTLTAYKLYPRRAFERIRVETRGFETDHEITAKLVRQGVRIREVPIGYRPRSVAEGKKIRATDAVKAVWTLVRFRV
jgi:glycosyltransferase involved in cell wall biosynthesis